MGLKLFMTQGCISKCVVRFIVLFHQRTLKGVFNAGQVNDVSETHSRFPAFPPQRRGPDVLFCEGTN